MEQLDVFDCSNVLIASYFADDRECAHENREHTLIYQCSGRLEIEERGNKTVLYPGDCAFMRRDNRMWLQKRIGKGEPYRSIVLKFSKAFLRELTRMREVEVSRLTDVIEKLCIEANEHLPEDVKCAIKTCRACEDGEIAKGILDNIIENFDIADNENVPICQDTGMACVFLEIGQDVHFVGGDLTDAINEGVRRGYDKGYLRKSVVKDPVRRGNTGDNTPAMIYTEIVPGDQVKITVGPKGFGSENMSQIRMFKPSAGLQGIKDFILEVVETAGPNPCPPMVVGVGIGGTFDKCALLAKKALMRPLDTQNPDPFYADLEKEMLEKVNKLGIGPQGFGGKTTAIGLNIETMPTHIAGMPCAVNINCHVTRHKSEVI